MAPMAPSASNVFIPNTEASSNLKVEFSRNPNKFALNEYVQIQPTKRIKGKYIRITTEEAGRILNADGRDFQWDYGADRPMHPEGLETHSYEDFTTERFDLGFVIPDEMQEQAEWDIGASHRRMKAQQAMTLRTQKAATALTTAANFDSSHVSAVADIETNAGGWDESTIARGDIRRSIQYATELILADTLSAVGVEDLVLVMGPKAARAIAGSQEIIDYIKTSPEALNYVEVTGSDRLLRQFGLPKYLYGVKVVVETTAKATNAKGAAAAKSFLWTTSAALVSRPGALEAPEGPSFSTLTCLAYNDMLVEDHDDRRNKRTESHILDNYAMVVTAPISGFLFTGVYTP